jgi:DNA-binding PadR family transcriptional regulator
MQKFIRDWHKDEFLDLKRGSLYHAIERLKRDGLIDAVGTSREGRRPERTVYRLTDAGAEKCSEWLREMLAKPVREPDQFFAALSFLPHLPPETVRAQLEERLAALRAEVANLEMVLHTMIPRIGRLVLVEVEYMRSMKEAEAAWVRSILSDLRIGALSWDPDLMRQCAASATQPQ